MNMARRANIVKNNILTYKPSLVTLSMSSVFQHPELQPDSLHPGPCLRRAQVTPPAVSSELHLQVPQWIQYSTLPFACYSTDLN